MIVDASAIVAILRFEETYDTLRAKLKAATDPIRIGAPTLLEAAIVIDGKRDPVASRALDDVIELYGIEQIAFSSEHMRVAREAYRDFGRGGGHPAKLNFGDCMTYATAKIAREPLLFVGDDFPHTDVQAA